MITGTTKSGFEFTLEDDVLDDYDLLLQVAALDKGDFTRLDDTFDTILGKAQKNKLREHIKKVTNRKKVSASLMIEAFHEIFDAAGEAGKNS
jgi:hypothetical protein